MSYFRCLIQADQAADQRRDQLEAGLHEIHTRHYPGETTSVDWAPVPPGRMFTEGKPSTSSIVSCFIAHETEFAQREQYLREVCDLWSEVTGCTDHEVVATVTETVPAN